MVNLSPLNMAGKKAWGDYNNDGYLDILQFSYAKFKPYINNRQGGFTPKDDLTIASANTAFMGDIDNDNDIDFVFQVYEDGVGKSSAQIYTNTNGNIELKTSIETLYQDKPVMIDYDNDGDLDLFFAIASKMYRNNGNNQFAEQSGISLPPQDSYYVSCADYDNDGYTDMLVTTGQYESSSSIYRNVGGNFVEQKNILIDKTVNNVQWIDYDNDGDLDISLLTAGSQSIIAKLYKNNGDNSFSPINAPGGSWTDYDNDGDLDILSGSSGYRNDGNDVFVMTNDLVAGLPDNPSWGDYDNDGDLDMLADTYSNEYQLYQNRTQNKNSRPLPPSDIKAYISDNSVKLTWNTATDGNQTGGLSYNLYIRNTDNNTFVVAPLADISIGKRYIAQMGNAQLATSKTYYLPKGKYVWAVQAIDNSLVGSAFSAEQTFSVTTNIAQDKQIVFNTLPNPANEQLLIDIGYPTDFTLQLVGIDGTMYEQQTFTKQSQALLTRLPRQSGLYFVRVITPTGVGTQKVMIQRKE